MPQEIRWWPIDGDGSTQFRTADLCYAALGPHLTHRLIAALEDTPDHTIDDPQVIRFRERLQDVDGRPPVMLILLASAMAVVEKALFNGLARGREEDERYGALLRHYTETYKHLGSLTVEAVQRFGWNERTFLEYCEEQTAIMMGTSWPPAGAAHTRRPPHATPARRAPSDFDAWHSISPEPSLIGAHLVNLVDLTRYVADLEIALMNAPRDLQATDGVESPGSTETDDAVRRLTEAVMQIRHAEQLIRRAQDVISEIFPT